MPANNQPTVAVIGGGPAGLMAAETLVQGGAVVHLYDAMPSVGRKFLLAGKGGLNLTHGESYDAFVSRYAERSAMLKPFLDNFGPAALIAWAGELGIETFTGTSNRVFPKDMKAAPLLRAWLHRLRAQGVRFHLRHRWRGWDGEGALLFDTPRGEARVTADATILAMGGGSWPRLGSDGAWVATLQARGLRVSALKPANCGFDVASPRQSTSASAAPNAGAMPNTSAMPNTRETPGWSEHFRGRYAGQPLKPVAISVAALDGNHFQRQGEFVVTNTGVEGSLIYAASAMLRDVIAASGTATLHIDLLPDWTENKVLEAVAHPRGARSLSSHLQSRTGLKGIKMALLRELLPEATFANAAALARNIKALPIQLIAARPLAEAISTAGGVPFEALNAHLMSTALPGVFLAGEMLDWEAPTGGYLLTVCFATGRAAGQGALAWLATFTYPDRSSASKAEYAFKQLSAAKKRAMAKAAVGKKHQIKK